MQPTIGLTKLVDWTWKPMILTAGGTLVPGHGTGEVALIDTSTGILHAVSQPKEDYFYHQASLIDMNGDGRDDILAARASVPTGR